MYIYYTYTCKHVYFIVIHIACAPRVINGDNVILPVDEWHIHIMIMF